MKLIVLKQSLRNFNQKTKSTLVWSSSGNKYGGSITYDPSIGTRFRVLGSGHIERDSTNPNYGAYKARSFLVVSKKPKLRLLKYRLDSISGIRPRGSVIAILLGCRHVLVCIEWVLQVLFKLKTLVKVLTPVPLLIEVVTSNA